jgi:hypothetical protein
MISARVLGYIPDTELVAAAGRDGEVAGVWSALLLPGIASDLIAFASRLEAAITFIPDRAEPEPALRLDARRWVGQGAVPVHEGPEVLSDVGLGGAVFHGNIMAARFKGSPCRWSGGNSNGAMPSLAPSW